MGEIIESDLYLCVLKKKKPMTTMDCESESMDFALLLVISTAI